MRAAQMKFTIIKIAGMCALAALPAQAQQGATVPELTAEACKRRLPDGDEAAQRGCQIGVMMTLRTLCHVEKVTRPGAGNLASEEMREFLRCIFASATAVFDRSEADYKAHGPRKKKP